MEIIIFAVVVGALGYIGYRFLNHEKPDGSHPLDAATQAPYKIEPKAVAEPPAVKCGCGRSATGFCVGLHKLSEDEWAVHPDNTNTKSAEKKTAKPRSRNKKTTEQ